MTPTKNQDCMSPGGETIPFLSPDVANYLEIKGYDKVAEGLDLLPTMGKVKSSFTLG